MSRGRLQKLVAEKNNQLTVEMMKMLVDYQKKALDDFGEKYLK